MVLIDATKGLPRQNDETQRNQNLNYSVRVIVCVYHTNGNFESLSFGRYSFESNEWMVEGFGGNWAITHWAYQVHPITKQIIIQ